MLWIRIKKGMKLILPESVLNLIWKIPVCFEYIRAYLAFLCSKKHNQKLGWEELDSLQKQYVCPRKEMTLEQALQLARHRIDTLLQLLPKDRKPGTVLETGAGDGLFSIVAHRQYGIQATAIDLSIRPNPELEKNEIDFKIMDVTNMEFKDCTFDCVVSFDAFEHFMDPSKALLEMLRVTKPKGFVYLDFGPIYYSAYGLHLYKCIYVPYSQYLFDYEMMKAYVAKNNLPFIAAKTLNQWSLKQYDQLFQSVSAQADIIHRTIINDTRHLKLVRKYPGLFKAQTPRFQDLIHNRITLILQKK